MTEFDKYSSNYKELLDDSVAGSGESHAYFSQYKANYIARRIPIAGDNVRFLDYGCGIGLLSESIKETIPGVRLDGYDVSGDSIDKVSAELKAQGTYTSNLEELSGNYDLIVVSNVMHHIPPEERTAVFSTLHGLLARAGKIVVIEHNPLNPLTRRAVDQCPFDADAVLLPIGETTGYFNRLGMKIWRRDYIVFFPAFLSFLRGLEPYLSFLPIGAQYAVIGEKHS